MHPKTKFVIEGFKMSIPAESEVEEFSFSFPFGIELVKGVYFDLIENKGDVLNVSISPELVIGQTIVSAIPETTTLYVTQSVLDYLHVGYDVSIADGNNFQDLGKCLLINKNALTIIVENPILNDYATGAAILMTIPLVRNVTFSGGSFANPIKGTEKTSSLPKNTTILVKYKNNEAVAKNFMFNLEYLF
jgi:hypothetical protein